MSNDAVTKSVDGVSFHMDGYKNHTGDFDNYRFLDGKNSREDSFGDLMYDKVHNDFLGEDKIDVDAAIGCWKDAADPETDDPASVSSDSLDKFEEWSGWFDPAELDALCTAGKISEDTRDSLKAGCILQFCGYSGNDLDDMMENFWALSDTERAAFLETGTGITNYRKGHDTQHYHDDSYSLENWYNGERTQAMQLGCAYLAESDHDDLVALADSDENPPAMQQFMDLDFTGSYQGIDDNYESKVSRLQDVDDWSHVPDSTRDYIHDIVRAMPREYRNDSVSDTDGTGTSATGSTADTQLPEFYDPADFAKSEALTTFLQHNTLPNDPTQLKALVEAQCPSFSEMRPEAQQEVLDWMGAAMDPNNVVKENGDVYRQIVDVNGAPILDEHGEPKLELIARAPESQVLVSEGMDFEDTMNIGCLMFMVLMERMASQENLIRSYGDVVDSKNDKLADANAAADALRQAQAASDDDEIDLDDVEFTDSSGKVITLTDYIEDSRNNIEISDDFDLDHLNSDGVNAVISSLDSHSDELSTDAQSSLQTLQQATSRYTTTGDLLSNFEKSWSNGALNNIGNMK